MEKVTASTRRVLRDEGALVYYRQTRLRPHKAGGGRQLLRGTVSGLKTPLRPGERGGGEAGDEGFLYFCTGESFASKRRHFDKKLRGLAV
jgi:hypothetical protein